MPTNDINEFRVEAGELKDQSFSNPQEMLVAFCAVMIIRQLTPLPASTPATSGNRTTIASEVRPVPSGQSYVDFAKDVTSSSPVLVTTDDPPTIGIKAISGTKVYLTGAAPNANYSVKITTTTVA